MTAGDILDGAFKLLKADLTSMAAIVAVFVAPLTLLSAFLLRDEVGGAGFVAALNDWSLFDAGADEPLTAELRIALAVGVIQLLLLSFMAGAIAVVVASSYLGERVGPGAALRRMLRRVGALFASWLVVHVLEVLGIVVAVALVAGASATASSALVAVAVLVGLALAPAVLLLVMGYSVLVAPAVVVEDLGPMAGIRRSWGLVRDRFWPVLGTALLGGLIASIIASVLTTVPQALAAAVVPEAAAWLVVGVGNALISVVTQPIVAIVATLLYFDARIRKEGFDLQVIAAELSEDRGPIS